MTVNKLLVTELGVFEVDGDEFRATELAPDVEFRAEVGRSVNIC